MRVQDAGEPRFSGGPRHFSRGVHVSLILSTTAERGVSKASDGTTWLRIEDAYARSRRAHRNGWREGALVGAVAGACLASAICFAEIMLRW